MFHFIQSFSGNIIAGILLGPSLFNMLDSNSARNLEPVTIFVMGLITVVIGGHLNYRRLRTAMRRILAITLVEDPISARRRSTRPSMSPR